jgi:alkylated DNA repair protein (DNA oxidative demethylase)
MPSKRAALSRSSSTPAQSALFEFQPAGLSRRDDFMTAAEEAALLEQFAGLAFKPFAFQGWFGKRETVSFGWRYDFNDARMYAAPPIPDFLLPIRARAAQFAGLEPAALEQALVIRYDLGAGIGWHRDRPAFEKVIGISLGAPCDLRFRQRTESGFRRFMLHAAPRSIYLLTGEIRHEWEHSIVPMEAQRYSITFRSRKDHE